MNIKVSLFDSTTDDLAIVIDLLRASTTVTMALNSFEKVIAVNDKNKALEYKKQDDEVILAGEENLNNIEGFDLTNSPEHVQEYKGKTLILKTTNGTKVIENIINRNPNVKVLVGAGINANALARAAIKLADNEIELIMAGRHGVFNIEDAIGAGLIVEQIIEIANVYDIALHLEESAIGCLLLAEDHDEAVDLIYHSKGGCRLRNLGAAGDVDICCQINTVNTVPIYKDGEIKRLE